MNLFSYSVVVTCCPGVLALVLRSEQEPPFQMRSTGQQVLGMHISKVGMTSLCGELLVQNVWPGKNSSMECTGAHPDSYVKESCLPSLHQEGAFHIALFREPRAWAVSAFTQCIGMSENPFFKALEDTDWSVPAFRRWLEHFGSGNWSAGTGTWSRSLDCYTPINFQAEALTCHTDLREADLWHHDVLTLQQSSQAATDAQRTLLEFVGITELYDESVCLLWYQLNGTLMPWCDCEHFGVARDAIKGLWHPLEQHEAHERHHPPVSTLPGDILKAIDDISAVDRDLYGSAVRILLMRLHQLGLMLGVRLICPKQMQALQEKVHFLDIQAVLADVAR